MDNIFLVNRFIQPVLIYPNTWLQKNDKWRRVGMKPPRNGGEFWGFNEESDDNNYSFDEDEENTAGFKPILKARKRLQC